MAKNMANFARKKGENWTENQKLSEVPNGSKVLSKYVILFCTIEVTLKCRGIFYPIPAGVCSATGVVICVKYLDDSGMALVKILDFSVCLGLFECSAILMLSVSTECHISSWIRVHYK